MTYSPRYGLGRGRRTMAWTSLASTTGTPAGDVGSASGAGPMGSACRMSLTLGSTPVSSCRLPGLVFRLDPAFDVGRAVHQLRPARGCLPEVFDSFATGRGHIRQVEHDGTALLACDRRGDLVELLPGQLSAEPEGDALSAGHPTQPECHAASTAAERQAECHA